MEKAIHLLGSSLCDANFRNEEKLRVLIAAVQLSNNLHFSLPRPR